MPNKNADGTLDGSGKGVLAAIKRTEQNNLQVAVKGVGTVDYMKGEILVTTINITSTVADNDIIEIQAFPESNDIIGLKDLYLQLDMANTKINMVRDTISSGQQISGIGYRTTSSYSNGTIIRS